MQDGRYFVDDKEVAVFYFRTMYDPAHYKSPDFWRARRDMEFSAAVNVSLELVYYCMVTNSNSVARFPHQFGLVHKNKLSNYDDYICDLILGES